MANLEYTQVKMLGNVGNNITVELGHYKDLDKGTEYADKIYVFNHFTKKNGDACTSSMGKFTPAEFADLQKIDISDIDTDFNANEVFD